MSCKDCKYWNGRTEEWADCYRVVAEINPELLQCKNDHGMHFNIPFDPHDVKYFRYDEDFDREYKATCQHVGEMNAGIYVEKVKVSDVIYNDDGSERLGVLTLHYFRTHNTHNCDREESR